MANRKKTPKAPSLSDRVLAWVREYEGVTVQEVSEEFGITDVEANNVLVELSLLDYVDIRDGEWVPLAEDGEIAAPVETEEEKSEAANRLAYMANVAESQDGDMQYATPRPVQPPAELPKRRALGKKATDAPEQPTPDESQTAQLAESVRRLMAAQVKPQNRAQQPVKAPNGETITVPVSEGSQERRELDAAMGEKFIGESKFRVTSPRHARPVAAPAVAVVPAQAPAVENDKGLDQYIDPDTGDLVYESSIRKRGLWLESPESIPPRPEGIHPTTWDMAHTACTQTARDWWTLRAREQRAVWEIQNEDKPPF
jgi:hypothetical protein